MVARDCQFCILRRCRLRWPRRVTARTPLVIHRSDAGLARELRQAGKGEKLATKPDGRVCAVGYSLPTFHADKTFQNVCRDLRWQLANIIQAFVSSYSRVHHQPGPGRRID